MTDVESLALASFHDEHPAPEDLRAAVIEGLSKPQKSLPAKFFYDEEGSRLFDEICRLEEYYPMRTEIALLQAHGGEIAALAGPRCQLIEFGSGSSIKTRTVLDALDDPAAYVPIDISREHLLRSADELAAAYPAVEVMAVCADYSQLYDVPSSTRYPRARKIAFFPGSGIGNFTHDEAIDFLIRVSSIAAGGALIIGVDLKKDPAILNAAYNDSRGVTAAFNRNLLVRINRDLGPEIDVESFAHEAFYSEALGRVEMHLVSTRDQTIRIDGHEIEFAEGESIHTENSYKYSIEEFAEIAARAGFTPTKVWTDEAELFSIHYLDTP